MTDVAGDAAGRPLRRALDGLRLLVLTLRRRLGGGAGLPVSLAAGGGHLGGGGGAATGRAALVHDLMRGHETRLLQPLLDYLTSRNELRVLGPRDVTHRAPTVAIQAERAGEELARALAEHGIMAGGGSFYANRALQAQGADPDHGVLRLSFVHYTSQAEVDQLISALDRVL